MGFLGFLAEKKFYIHIGLSILVTLVIIIISFRLIKSYTRYGDALLLPDFSGLTLEQLDDKNYTDKFDFIVTDSIFSNDLLPGSVIKQNPSAGSKVKKGRNIYITLVAMTPEITTMPDIRDLTVRQAVTYLKNSGLEIKYLRFAPNMADNAVLGHYYNGDTLRAGDKLLSGSGIELLIGQSDNSRSPVPVLMGLTEEAATDLIHLSSFNVGKISYRDSLATKDGRVYLQSPGWSEESGKGGFVDLWLRSGSMYNFDSLLRVMVPDSAVMEEVVPEFPEDTLIFEE
jgi:eukaryotic-like serine/threonine-protein kinase